MQTQVHNAQNLIGDSSAGGKGLRPVASPLEKEVSHPGASVDAHSYLTAWLLAAKSAFGDFDD
jgi:hypothetical protein